MTGKIIQIKKKKKDSHVPNTDRTYPISLAKDYFVNNSAELI